MFLRSVKFVPLIVAGLLAGCVSDGVPSKIGANLPSVPSDVRVCFDKLVPAPGAKVALTNRELVQLVADLRASELGKSACGKRFLAFYDAVAGGLK